MDILDTFTRTLILIEGGKERVVFDYKYLYREDVLNISIERALKDTSLKKEDLLFFIIKEETKRGYYTAIKEGRNYYSREISRVPILLSDLTKKLIYVHKSNHKST